MPLANYRGSEEAVLHEIHEVTGRRQFAKQVLKLFIGGLASGSMRHVRKAEYKNQDRENFTSYIGSVPQCSFSGLLNTCTGIIWLELYSVHTWSLSPLVSIRLYQNTPNRYSSWGLVRLCKSGVPLAGEVVERAAKWAYAHENGREPEDPRLHRSDWFPWPEEKHWYNTQKSSAEKYAAAIQHLLQPRQNRKRFGCVPILV